jgi:hypothetical protein
MADYRFYTDRTSSQGLSLEEARRVTLRRAAALRVGGLGLVLEPLGMRQCSER